MGVCDPCDKETHPALFCENLNIIDLGNADKRGVQVKNPRSLASWPDKMNGKLKKI